MKEIVATITSKRQVTILAEIQRHLGVRKSDELSFVIEPEGTVRLKAWRYPTVASPRDAAGSLKKPLSWEEMLMIGREDRLKAKASND